MHSLAVHMMDNASALPTCAQQQQQRKLLLIDCAMRLNFRPIERALAVGSWNLTLEEPALTTRIVSIEGYAGSAVTPRRACA